MFSHNFPIFLFLLMYKEKAKSLIFVVSSTKKDIYFLQVSGAGKLLSCHCSHHSGGITTLFDHSFKSSITELQFSSAGRWIFNFIEIYDSLTIFANMYVLICPIKITHTSRAVYQDTHSKKYIPPSLINSWWGLQSRSKFICW